MTNNGRTDVHLQFTERQNLLQAVCHAAAGEPWEAVRVSKDGKFVLGPPKLITAGPALLEMFEHFRPLSRFLPYSSSLASEKDSTTLALDSLDWQKSVELSESVVRVRAQVVNLKHRPLWDLPCKGEDFSSVSTALKLHDGKGVPRLPSVGLFKQAYQRLGGVRESHSQDRCVRKACTLASLGQSLSNRAGRRLRWVLKQWVPLGLVTAVLNPPASHRPWLTGGK
jgi:hypothetical protein